MVKKMMSFSDSVSSHNESSDDGQGGQLWRQAKVMEFLFFTITRKIYFLGLIGEKGTVSWNKGC